MRPSGRDVGRGCHLVKMGPIGFVVASPRRGAKHGRTWRRPLRRTADGTTWHSAGKSFRFPKSALGSLVRARFRDALANLGAQGERLRAACPRLLPSRRESTDHIDTATRRAAITLAGLTSTQQGRRPNQMTPWNSATAGRNCHSPTVQFRRKFTFSEPRSAEHVLRQAARKLLFVLSLVLLDELDIGKVSE